MPDSDTGTIRRRTKSPLRAVPGRGDEFGIVITPADQARCALLARWYCLSREHVARHELPVHTWHPDLRHDANRGTGQPSPDFARQILGIRRRFTKLSQIQPNQANHTGPLVDSRMVHDAKTGWFATRYGATASATPWNLPTDVNPLFAAHAWAAADVGMQLERLGYRVLSERELASGVDTHGLDVTHTVQSTYTTPLGATVTKKPDLAVVSPNEDRYIAIEVERVRDRAISVYAEKLAAYEQNTAISAVWYLCGNEATRRRVIAAAEKVFGTRSFPLRIQVLRDLGGFYEVRGLTDTGPAGGELHPRLIADLDRIGHNTGAAA